ncbi:MAG TPA: hypothetical protein VHX59_25815 [Mycobacteriales bacterium]|jgi:hypothetical protein|nr:hypothetical protein [Mycobacteriales bacterium]
MRIIILGGTKFVGRAIASALVDRGDSAKAHQLLGWQGTGEALERSVRWHLDNPPQEWDHDFAADDKALVAVENAAAD